MTTARSRFRLIWEPRIGAQASAELRLYKMRQVTLNPLAVVLGCGGGALVGSRATASVVVAIAAFAVGAAAIGVTIVSQMRFARALSEWFGVRVRARDVPKMRSPEFDAWVACRGLVPAGDESRRAAVRDREILQADK